MSRDNRARGPSISTKVAENKHVADDSNSSVGDRPVRKHFNFIIVVVLLILVLAVLAGWLLIGVKGRNILPANKRPTPAISLIG